MEHCVCQNKTDQFVQIVQIAGSQTQTCASLETGNCCHGNLHQAQRNDVHSFAYVR